MLTGQFVLASGYAIGRRCEARRGGGSMAVAGFTRGTVMPARDAPRRRLRAPTIHQSTPQADEVPS